MSGEESAFPEIRTEASYDNGDGPYGETSSHGGLTKRELLAAMAMQGMLSHATRYQPHNPGTPWMECMSTEAVNLADALIAELEKATARRGKKP